MTAQRETRYFATYLYPGLMVPERWGRVRIPAPTAAAVLDAAPDGRWFAADVEKVEGVTYSDTKGSDWGQFGSAVHCLTVYVGTEYTAEQVKAREDAAQLEALLWNMDHNGWPIVVRHRSGGWQPVRPGDIVISAEA